MKLSREALDARVAAFVLSESYAGIEPVWNERDVWITLIGQQFGAIYETRMKSGALHPVARTRCPRDHWILDRLFVPLRGDDRLIGVLLFEKATKRFGKRLRHYNSGSAAVAIAEVCGDDPERVCVALGNLESAVWWSELQAMAVALGIIGVARVGTARSIAADAARMVSNA